MRPKIQLVGRCATTFESDVVSNGVSDTGRDSSESGMAGTLLEQYLAIVIKAVDASAGIVRVLSPDGLVLRTIGCAGIAVDICQTGCYVDAGCGVCGKAATGLILEASDADFCKRQVGAEFFVEACKFVLAVPLRTSVKDTGPEGVLTLFFSNEKNISGDVERTLKSYAELMQIALRNVWRTEDAHQQNLLAERQSIANEIHDSLAQTLYFAKIRSSLLLDALKSKNELLAYKCAQDIDEALQTSQITVRELVTHFRCQMDPRGLQFALQKLARDFVERTKIKLEYDNQVAEFNLPLEYELQIFLIIRESLVNIATHSGANLSSLLVTREDNLYRFVVEDNGGGVGSGEAPEGHYGLAIMHERALRIGGVVEVEGLLGRGTRVQLSFSAPMVELG